MTFRAQIAGFRIVEVPIIFVERRAGHSKMSKRVIWESMWMPIKLRAREGALRRRIRRLNKAKGEKSGGLSRPQNWGRGRSSSASLTASR